MPRLAANAPAKAHAQKSLAESGLCFGVAVTGLTVIAIALQLALRLF